MLSSLVVFIVPCESVDDPSASIFSIPFLTEEIFFPHWLARHNQKTVENQKNAREALETRQRLLEVPCF